MVEEPRFKWQDAFGIVGVLLAVAGMSDMPLNLRLACFALCAICLPISFASHKNWPLAIRWVLSGAVVCLMVFMGYYAHRKQPEPAHTPTSQEIAQAVLDAQGKNGATGTTTPPLKEISPPTGTGKPNQIPPVNPDVDITLIHPDSPALMLHNRTSVIVRDVLYWFELIDLNSIENGHINFLPIPTAKVDWIRPKDASGPMGIFTNINNGDHVCGFIGATCPECKRKDWLYMESVYGRDAWYVKLTEEEVKEFLGKSISFPIAFPQARHIPVPKTE